MMATPHSAQLTVKRSAAIMRIEAGGMISTNRSSRTNRRLLLTTALVVLVSVQAPTPPWGWGRLGNRLTARIAERHLTPQAKAAVEALLEPGETLADASTWADEHRREIRGSGPWHYVDVPLDEPRYDARFSGPDPRKGCIVDKIREFKAILKDPAGQGKFPAVEAWGSPHPSVMHIVALYIWLILGRRGSPRLLPAPPGA
jgi:hypothetical protein